MTIRGWASAGLTGLALTLALAGCGGEKKAADTGGGGTDAQEAMLAYADCMRKNGVDMPDPEGGGFVITPDQEATRGEGGRRFEEADGKCRRHLADIRPPKLTEGEQEELREALLKHARCLREHGVNVPDPDFSGDGRAAIPLDDVDLDDPKFKAAQKACEKYLRGGGSVGPGGAVP